MPKQSSQRAAATADMPTYTIIQTEIVAATPRYVTPQTSIVIHGSHKRQAGVGIGSQRRREHDPFREENL